eukprot:Amastigsp_a689469_25.p2 type:complete len:108 gc:universal Amastigsp_a689469_25:801-478(-)
MSRPSARSSRPTARTGCSSPRSMRRLCPIWRSSEGASRASLHGPTRSSLRRASSRPPPQSLLQRSARAMTKAWKEQRPTRAIHTTPMTTRRAAQTPRAQPRGRAPSS